jgi:VIT1/CCC1 family predicted Fe2+/Mn2+ transporter
MTEPVVSKRHAHGEHHFRAPALVRDVVIGAADGLTVPFALAAGLAGAVDAVSIVVMAGLAEIAAGSIAMGLGGYLAARTDAEHYASEYQREWRETVELPNEERAEVEKIFREQGLEDDAVAQVADAITADRTRWVEFMMRYELGLETPDPKRAPASAATIALSYVAGGIIPLAPYMLLRDIAHALPVSVALTLVALFIFGYGKALLTGMRPLKGGLQTLVVGGMAATAAYVIARLVR